MEVGKWNYKTKTYDDYKLPSGAAMLAELDAIVWCAECGRKMIYGNAYTSRRIHNQFGLGFAVCTSCYDTESRTEEAQRRKQ